MTNFQYFFSFLLVYDLVAGSKCIKSSYVLSREKAIELFPMLRKDKLCGAIVYYDGQHNDARMNIAIALTAARLGATVANHVRVVCAAKILSTCGLSYSLSLYQLFIDQSYENER